MRRQGGPCPSHNAGPNQTCSANHLQKKCKCVLCWEVPSARQNWLRHRVQKVGSRWRGATSHGPGGAPPAPSAHLSSALHPYLSEMLWGRKKTPGYGRQHEPGTRQPPQRLQETPVTKENSLLEPNNLNQNSFLESEKLQRIKSYFSGATKYKPAT